MRASAALRALPRTVRAVLADGAALAPPASGSGSGSGSASASASDSSPPTSVPAEVHGWVRTLRAHKNISFAEVDDGSGGAVQAVLRGAVRDGIAPGTSVRLAGELRPSRGAGQAVELVVNEAELLGSCGDDFPIQKKALPPPVLREHAHLRFRAGSTAAVMRVRDALARDFHDWFEDHEFVHVHTPLLTASDCEGAGEVFTLAQSLPPASPSSPPAFFPRPVNLTVSGQLHLEAPTHALSRTYTLSPCFRAEPSQTSRHLAEFYMLEAEVAFVSSLGALCDVVEDGMRDTLRSLLAGTGARARRARADVTAIAGYTAATEEEALAASSGSGGKQRVAPVDQLAVLSSAIAEPFARITYSDAIAVLQAQHAKEPFAIPPEWDDGLSSQHEKWLAGEHFGRPTFVTHYPAAMKPFYMLPSDAASDAPRESARGPTVAAFDLLFPGIGEMCGGSLREHRLDALLAAIKAQGLAPEEYSWYLDLRRFGTVPHGGWGMGWERWVCYVAGVANVRDVVAFPRWAGSCRF